MKIFDCTLFYDEDMILEIRLNMLNKYVDKFVISESKYTHNIQIFANSICDHFEKYMYTHFRKFHK